MNSHIEEEEEFEPESPARFSLEPELLIAIRAALENGLTAFQVTKLIQIHVAVNQLCELMDAAELNDRLNQIIKVMDKDITYLRNQKKLEDRIKKARIGQKKEKNRWKPKKSKEKK